MGILNLTPDSFSDGGALANPKAAALKACELARDGADWLDVGGESTRPGAQSVTEAEEHRRVIPAIEAINAATTAPISVDTMKPGVARAAMAAGATMWNDVGALRAPGALKVAAELGCQVVLMHMRGTPATMQHEPRYGDVVEEVLAFLNGRVEAAVRAGVAAERIWLDPGLGFGKTPAHNLALLHSIDRIAALGFPVLVGASRKGLIRSLDPSAREPADRLGGSLALALAAARSGAAMLRVHDVRETVQALRVDAAVHG